MAILQTTKPERRCNLQGMDLSGPLFKSGVSWAKRGINGERAVSKKKTQRLTLRHGWKYVYVMDLSIPQTVKKTDIASSNSRFFATESILLVCSLSS